MERGMKQNNGKIAVRSDDGNRVIGFIDTERRIFVKSNWHSDKHLCRKHNAIGIDKGAFQNYIEPLARLVVVPDKTTGNTWQIAVEDFTEHSIEDDLGWGRQIFCPLSAFSVVEPDSNRPRQLVLSLGGAN